MVYPIKPSFNCEDKIKIFSGPEGLKHCHARPHVEQEDIQERGPDLHM